MYRVLCDGDDNNVGYSNFSGYGIMCKFSYLNLQT